MLYLTPDEYATMDNRRYNFTCPTCNSVMKVEEDNISCPTCKTLPNDDE